MKWEGKTLSEYFPAYFPSFKAANFSRIPNNDLRMMRYLLHNRGVFVRKGRRTQISVALYEVIKEDVDWSAEELESGE